MIEVIGTPDIKVITGVRRSGKSKLLELFKEYIKDNVKNYNIIDINYTLLDFEDLKEYHKLNEYVENNYKKGMNNKESIILEGKNIMRNIKENNGKIEKEADMTDKEDSSKKEDKMIAAYQNGESLNSIARTFKTYPTTVSRILKKNGVELRHDIMVKGSHTVINDGEKLIEWAKAQGRLVTKKELAELLGKTRLSQAYFQKYPELGQYVASYEQKELSKYTEQLFNWLKENDIPYIPNDRSALSGIPVQAKLLNEYANVVIVLDVKSPLVSNKQYNEMIHRRLKRAKEKGVSILNLTEKDFENLCDVKKRLDDLKVSNENDNLKASIENIDTKKNQIENDEKILDKYKLAKMYYFGEKVEQNYEKAFNLFSDLTEKYNYERAIIFLSEMFYCGYYVEKNTEMAFKYYNEIFDGEFGMHYENIMIFSIAEYLEEIGCIDEADAKKYWTMNVRYFEIIKVIQKMFKNILRNTDYNTKIKVLQYVQKYVKIFYNENSDGQNFVEEVLDELLNHISFYDPKYVKKIKRGVYAGDIENSIINYSSVVEDLFSYPARKVQYSIVNKDVLSDNSISILKWIICECIINNKLSLADELMNLLYNSNPKFISYEFYSSLITSLDISKIDLKKEQSEFLAKWKNYRKWTI